VEVREATSADAVDAAALAASHAWPDYGFYRLYGYDFGSAYLVRAVEHLVGNLPGTKGVDQAAVLATEGGEAVGFAAVVGQPWETEHFGLAMGGVPFLLAPAAPGHRAELVDALLGALEKTARCRGLVHLSTRFDIADVGGLQAAQRRGWRVADTLVTWVHDSQGMAAATVSDPRFECVTLGKLDLCRIAREDLAPFEEFMRRGYRVDRFHADLRLPAERSDELYVQWFRKVFDGSWADGAQAIRMNGRLVGFCSFQHARDVEAEFRGPRIIGRGLAAVLPEAKGGYAVLTRMIHHQCPLGSRFQEFDTQLQNFPTINVWARENMRFVRARATLHRWLDEG
jgi:hypothetical protein